MSDEIWLDIPGYELKYQISNLGSVRSYYREQEFIARWGVAKMRFPAKNLKISRTKTGYCYVALSSDGVQKKHLIHRLVLLAFVGPSDLQVNHIDGKKDNNALGNIEYVTCLENLRHCIDVLGKKRGEKSGTAKLTEQDVLSIRKDDRFLKDIAKDYGVTLQAIHMVKARKNWSHVL